jgi:hypothetical protein
VLATAFAAVTTNNDIDLLFVIDNSESMADEDQGQCGGPDARLSISVYGRVPPAAGAEVAVHCPLA